MIALVSMSFVITLFMTIWFRRENARRANVLRLGNFTPEELKTQEENLGDKAITFKYVV